MKIPAIIIVLGLWVLYLVGKDRVPASRWNHVAINVLYAGMFTWVLAYVQ